MARRRRPELRPQPAWVRVRAYPFVAYPDGPLEEGTVMVTRIREGTDLLEVVAGLRQMADDLEAEIELNAMMHDDERTD